MQVIANQMQIHFEHKPPNTALWAAHKCGVKNIKTKQTLLTKTTLLTESLNQL